MRILAIGDTHSPFAHPNTLDFLADLKRCIKPDLVVHIGDLGDQYGWSKHGRQDPDSPGQGEECSQMVAWNQKLYKAFPKVKACIGNHDKRLAKAANRAGIPSRLIRSLQDVYESPPGWEWAENYVLDGVAFAHGVGFGGADCAIKAARSFCQSCVIGHNHSVGGVRWLSSELTRIFGCSAGCLVDAEAVAMAYAKESAAKPVLGSVAVLHGVPQFLPMI